MALEMKDELLFMRFVFGFRRFNPCFPLVGLSSEVPSSNPDGLSEPSSPVG
jgi:hypothetical protein